MKKRTYFARIIALVTALLMILSGCGTTAGNNPSGSGSGNGGGGGDATDIMSIEMPTADLSNNDKVLTLFGWSSMDENETDGEAASYFEEEFGVTIDVTISTHDTYWVDFAKMVAADNAPDVVDLTYPYFWPTPISDNLFQPWDGLIDFNTPLWADTKELIDAQKWNDKIYCPVISEFVANWFYYNKAMFRDYGLENDTPSALYERDEWTLDKMVELANGFVEKNNKNEITQWGFTCQTFEPLVIAGVPIVEITNGTEYKNNLRDPKIAKVMNAMQEMSLGLGSGAFTGLDCNPAFIRGDVPMIMSQNLLMTNKTFEDFHLEDTLGIAPYPKLDDESKYCVEMAIDPGYGLANVTGVNKELAALWVNYLKWFRLGENLCPQIPISKNTPAKERYSLKAVSQAYPLDAEEIKFIEDYLASENTQKVYNTYRSILVNIGDFNLFKYSIYAGETTWSAAIQQLYPRYETKLKDYIKNK